MDIIERMVYLFWTLCQSWWPVLIPLFIIALVSLGPSKSERP